jgi:hypothetical protein
MAMLASGRARLCQKDRSSLAGQGQTLQADFGWLGAMRVRFVDEAGDPRD